MNSEDQKAIVRHEFTKQADAYAASTSITNPERIERLIRAVAPAPEARVLEVATGPGYVACGFAAASGEVIGIDITDALLEIAERNRRERGLSNLRFQRGDAEQLPFGDAEFDVVVCRLAFHHLADPAAVLREMARVCRPNGTVAVEDMVGSEHPERAAYQNRFENLRDPSHLRALPLSELLRLFAASGLEVETVYSGQSRPEVEHWMERAQTPPEAAAEVRAMLERDLREDLSGTRPHYRDGILVFTQMNAAVIGRRLVKR